MGASVVSGRVDTPSNTGGLSVHCRGVVHLYRTFEGHDVVALQGVDLDISAGEILRAVFAEVCVVLGAAGLAGVAAGSAAQYIVVRTVTLGFTDEIRTPRVVATLDAQGIGVLMAVVVTVLVGIATCAASLAVRRDRASTLRESVR